MSSSEIAVIENWMSTRLQFRLHTGQDSEESKRSQIVPRFTSKSLEAGRKLARGSGVLTISCHSAPATSHIFRCRDNAILQEGALWPRSARTSLRAQDGIYRWNLQQAMALRDGNGKVFKFVVTMKDIDDQKWPCGLDLQRWNPSHRIGIKQSSTVLRVPQTLQSRRGVY